MTENERDPVRLRFGVNLGRLGMLEQSGEPLSGPVEAARWAEEAGFDVVTTADHVGSTSPFVMLTAAAVVTTRVRLRTYVLDYGFWNAGLLARDVATLDVLSGGRVEVGLGAGHKPLEHEAVGASFPPFRERIAGMEAMARRLRRYLDDPEFRPAPVQRPVPLLIGAMSVSALEAAATVGDTVALAGAVQLPGHPAGTLTLVGPDTVDERVRLVQDLRASQGLPPATFDALLQQVVLGSSAEDLAQAWEEDSQGAIKAADIVDSPFFLAAPTAQDAATELVRRRDRWGITSWCTHAPSGPALAEVLAAARAMGA
jgi:probable F420-dependent oxidoreductase